LCVLKKNCGGFIFWYFSAFSELFHFFSKVRRRTHFSCKFVAQIVGPAKMVQNASFSEREKLVIKRLRPRFTLEKIARLFGSSTSAVGRIVGPRAFSKKEIVPSPKKPTKPRPLLKKRRKIVLELASATDLTGERLHPTANCIKNQLARKHNIIVCKATIVNDLHFLGLHSYVRPKVCCLQVDHARRLAFCKKMLGVDARWLHFSDEKLWDSNNRGYRQEWVTDRRALTQRIQTRWPSARVMVWGIIGVGFRKLVVFPTSSKSDGETTPFRLDGKQYVRRCLVPVSKYFQAGSQRVFQQDGAGAHQAGARYLAEKRISFIHDWPARSPDLSPIETLWSSLSVSVSAKHPTNRDELVAAIWESWNAYPQEKIDELVLSFTARIRKVIENNGLMS